MEVSGSLLIDISFLPLILILQFTSRTMQKRSSTSTTNETMILTDKLKLSHVGILFISGTFGSISKWKLSITKRIQEKVVYMNGKPRRYSGSASVYHIITLRSLIGGGAGGTRPSDVTIMA